MYLVLGTLLLWQTNKTNTIPIIFVLVGTIEQGKLVEERFNRALMLTRQDGRYA